MSKTFTLNSIIPRITSVTKTEASSSKPKATLKRAKGRVLTIRSAKAVKANTAASTSRVKVGVIRSSVRSISRFLNGNWIGNASAVGLVAIVVGMGFYVFMINASSSTGYELKRQQAAIQELTEVHKSLVIQQAASGSIVKVNDVASTAGMVPVSGEEFLVANQISKR